MTAHVQRLVGLKKLIGDAPKQRPRDLCTRADAMRFLEAVKNEPWYAQNGFVYFSLGRAVGYVNARCPGEPLYHLRYNCRYMNGKPSDIFPLLQKPLTVVMRGIESGELYMVGRPCLCWVISYSPVWLLRPSPLPYPQDSIVPLAAYRYWARCRCGGRRFGLADGQAVCVDCHPRTVLAKRARLPGPPELEA